MHHHTKLLTLGLTGGIGSGKSTVAKILKESLGFGLIDADQISRLLTAPKGAAIDPIRTHFGTSFITADESLDRAKMRNLVFTNPNAKSQLESILHPLIQDRIQTELSQAAQQGLSKVVFDIPLLAESFERWKNILDAVLVVDCAPNTQIARVTERSGLTEQEILNIIRAQASREQRNAIANWVILNDGISLGELKEQVLAIDFDF
jgi:dephospho-CoA kinase